MKNKTNYERVDAKITTKIGETIHYNVLEMCVKTTKDECIENEQELLDVFYEIVDQETRDGWNYDKIDLVRTWGDDTLTATIYG